MSESSQIDLNENTNSMKPLLQNDGKYDPHFPGNIT